MRCICRISLTGFVICGEDVCAMWLVSSLNIKELYFLGREDVLFAKFFDGADCQSMVRILSFVNLGRLRAISTVSSLMVL